MGKATARPDGLILDMDGTLYLGEEPLPGALEFVRRLEARGLPFLYLTNNSARDAEAYVEKLRRLGFPAEPGQVLTSGEATALWLKQHHPGTRLFVLGTPSLRREFDRAGFELSDGDADLVVLGFDMTLTYERLAQACHLIRRGVPWIATHPDINCPVPEGFIPDAGAIAAAIVASTGVSPQAVIGKPSRFIYEVALERLGTTARRTAMIGDRLYTDVAGAREAGLIGVLVLTGEARREDLDGSPVQPDLVVEGVWELITQWDL
ncbi:MAG: HAD-IIA family hydrolase [Anaerolineae bacterium]